MEDSHVTNDLGHYFKAIKSLFPVYGKDEKNFLDQLKANMLSHVESNPDCDYVQLMSLFGEPNAIVAQYLSDADSQYLIKRIKSAKYIRRGIVAAVVIALIAASAVIGLEYKSYLELQDAYVDREVTVIEKES